MLSIIIPAGGSGHRLGGKTKKQFLKLNDKPLLHHSLLSFIEHPDVKEIIVSLPADELDRADLLHHELVTYIEGGETRSESVYNGFKSIKAKEATETVLIHDGARPFVSHDLIDKVVKATREVGAAVPAFKISDTIKEIDDNHMVKATVNRERLRTVQTPQGFSYALLSKAYQKLDFKNGKYTDESMLVEALGVKVGLVDGEPENIKITTQFDMVVANSIIEHEKRG